VTQKMV